MLMYALRARMLSFRLVLFQTELIAIVSYDHNNRLLCGGVGVHGNGPLVRTM